MNYALETTHLSKRYKDLHAVKDLSLSINKGDIYGFIGLNGAGKTTTMRMLLGMIQPTKGKCHILGQRVDRKNVHIWNQVGYIVEEPHAYPELTVKENLQIIHKLRSVEDPYAVDRAMQQLQITKYAHVKAKNLSLGNFSRLGIAKAILHNPKILILDEPTNGLDPAGIVEIRNFLKQLACHNETTIFISSHQLEEIAKIATNIGMIHEGRLIHEIKSKQLNKQLNKQLIIDTINNQKALHKLLAEGYEAQFMQDQSIKISSKEAIQNPEKISRFLVYNHTPPKKLVVHEEDLESYFLRMIDRRGSRSS